MYKDIKIRIINDFNATVNGKIKFNLSEKEII